MANDVFFTRDGGCYAKHRPTGEEIEILRRGGQFEIDAEVQAGKAVKSVGICVRRAMWPKCCV